MKTIPVSFGSVRDPLQHRSVSQPSAFASKVPQRYRKSRHIIGRRSHYLQGAAPCDLQNGSEDCRRGRPRSNKDATQHCCSNRAQYHRGCFGGVRCCRKGAILALDMRGINRERVYGATAATPNYVRSLSRGMRLLRPRFHIKHSALVVSVGR